MGINLKKKRKKNKMGHLINPISLQIKYQGSWKLAWNQYLRKDFAYFFFLDQYIKGVVDSIMYLKSFFNKFFFYEIKYFIKKTFFKFYWNYKYPFYLFSNYPNFKKKKKLQKLFEKNYKRTRVNTFNIIDKIKFIDN